MTRDTDMAALVARRERELDLIADQLRGEMRAMQFARADIPNDTPLPWSRLTASERNQWRDHARAAIEVLR